MPKFKFKTRACIDAAKKLIGDAIGQYCDGKGGELIIRRPDKSRDQEEKYHAIIGDIARYGVVEYMGHKVDFREYSLPENQIAKILLVCWFEDDLRSSGVTLRNPGQWILDPVTKTPIRERAMTRLFTIEEGGWFIEFLMVVVAENKIPLSDKATRAYEEYKEVKS